MLATPPRDSPRRAAILNAALDAFAVNGIGGTTIADVRERSGASVGSIYHHFGGKDRIAGTLYVEGLRDYQAGFLRELQRHRDARAGIEAVVSYHLRWVASHPDLARFLLAAREHEAVAAAERELRGLNRRFLRAVESWLSPHVASGAFRALPVDVADALWLGPSQEYARHWLAGRATTPLEEAEAALAAGAWQALKRVEGDHR